MIRNWLWICGHPLPAGRGGCQLYDLGDYWEHDLRLEAIVPEEPGVRYPRIIAGARSCPPEDSGGADGYARLLEILLDPSHEDFDFMREWAGASFNAEIFSIDSVNERLRKIRHCVQQVNVGTVQQPVQPREPFCGTCIGVGEGSECSAPIRTQPRRKMQHRRLRCS